ncbi:MAG: universal stress protein [Myxococcales bacterium]|nr:universal stress protein [Myxococcales bacterium]MDH3484992.1 universal stress protein [Myxococcales bacterium]
MKPLIIICTDFSASSEKALRRGAEIAARDNARVFLVHVCGPRKGPAPGAPEWDSKLWYEDSMSELKRARHEHFRGLSDTEVQYDAIPSAHPASAICKVAKETGASLIVLGSHGRTGVLRQLLGSVAETTVRHAPCSVFVVRDDPRID